MRKQRMWSDDTISSLDTLLSPRQIQRLERKKRKADNNEQPTHQKSERHHQNRVMSLKPIQAKTPNQATLLDCLKNFDQVVVFGPAGTGKTYCATTYAAQEFIKGNIERIVITRPNKEIENSLGFFPGSIQEKLGVWLAETISILRQTLGSEAYEIALKNGDIEMVPFEVMRGRSFNNSIILVTEAQNTTIKEMTAFVTRTGEGSKVVIDGDLRQSDIGGDNGLKWVVNMIKNNSTLRELSGMVEFTSADIVRSGLCGAWVRAIEKQYDNAPIIVAKQ